MAGMLLAKANRADASMRTSGPPHSCNFRSYSAIRRTTMVPRSRP